MAFFTILKAVQSTCILTIISLSAMELLELSSNPELIGESDTELRCPFDCFCEATTYYVSCVSDVHIQVPALPISTRSVFFIGIQHVRKDAFSCCPHMNKIRLSLTLQSLSESAFKGLSNLTSLSIIESNIRELPNAIFRETRNLSELDLVQNKLSAIPNHALCETPQLKYIRFENNFITNPEFGRCFLGLRKLSNISLKSNKLRKLSGSDFLNLSNSPLRVLILSRCGIQYISMGAFKHLTHLKTLDISENRLLSLHQDVFVNLNQLDKLDIIGNRFRNFHFLNVSLKYLSYVGLSLEFHYNVF